MDSYAKEMQQCIIMQHETHYLKATDADLFIKSTMLNRALKNYYLFEIR